MLDRQIHFSERTILLIGLGTGLVLRFAQIATSIGSIDAYFWTRHVQIVEKVGLFRAYFAAEVINHPPLALEIARLTRRAGLMAGLQFFDSFRLLQTVADVIAALALLRLARHIDKDSALWIALVYFLSPATIFISAFHCNSDPLMMMFLLLAILAVAEERPLLAGIAIGAATGIKIIAFVAWPLLLLACVGWNARIRYLLASAITAAIIFLPALIASGWVVIRNIFLYTGWKGGWGLPLLGRIVELLRTGAYKDEAARFVTLLMIASIIALWCAEAWRTYKRGELDAARLPRVTGLAFLLVLVLAPGFLPHYFLWFLPFLAFLYSRRVTFALHALASVFLFALYTSWSGGWPWVYGGNMSSTSVGVFGLAVWAALAVAAAFGVRSLYRERVAV